jgi:sterol desaturase/sphingolipid hydroxylase (fatty acid hydroxylase superfamily)
VNRWHWPHLFLLATLPAVAFAAGATGVAPAVTLAAWLVLNVGVLALGERVQPHREDWRATPRHLRRDGSVWAMNLLVDVSVGAALAALAIAWLPGGNDWPLALQLVAGLALGELGSYALHRASHADGWLWRVHLLHHVPDRLNLANAITAHPVNAAYDKVARLAPALVLGLSPDAMLVIALFGATQALVAHANVAGTIGWLDRLVGSAGLHRLHHSTDPREAGNFGTALPLWDQLFGTYRRDAEPAKVGVFDPADHPREFELGRLLLWPFARRRVAWPWRCCGTPA